MYSSKNQKIKKSKLQNCYIFVLKYCPKNRIKQLLNSHKKGMTARCVFVRQRSKNTMKNKNFRSRFF